MSLLDIHSSTLSSKKQRKSCTAWSILVTSRVPGDSKPLPESYSTTLLTLGNARIVRVMAMGFCRTGRTGTIIEETMRNATARAVAKCGIGFSRTFQNVLGVLPLLHCGSWSGNGRQSGHHPRPKPPGCLVSRSTRRPLPKRNWLHTSFYCQYQLSSASLSHCMYVYFKNLYKSD